MPLNSSLIHLLCQFDLMIISNLWSYLYVSENQTEFLLDSLKKITVFPGLCQIWVKIMKHCFFLSLNSAWAIGCIPGLRVVFFDFNIVKRSSSLGNLPGCCVPETNVGFHPIKFYTLYTKGTINLFFFQSQDMMIWGIMLI